MRELIKRLLFNPFVFTQLLILSFFVNILALASPIFVMQVLQRYIAYGINSTLVTLVTGVTIAIIFEFFFRNLRHRIARGLDKENHKIKQITLSKLQSSKSIYGDLFKQFKYQNIDKLIQTIENVFSANSLIIILDLPFIIIFLVAIFLIHNTLGVITLSIILFVIIINYFISIFTNQILLKTAIEQKKEADIINKIVSQHSVIKIFNYEIIFEKIWSQIIASLLPLKKKIQARMHLSTSVSQTIVGLTTVAIIGIGSILVVSNELGVGALIAANILAARTLSPLIKYFSLRPNLLSGLHTLEELKKLTQIKEDKIKGSVIENINGKVVIEKLEFKYLNQKTSLLKNITVSVSPGQILVITGANGSGKTTIAKLLLGILEPNYGSISVDGVLINQLQQPWLRKNFIYLPQEIEFIDGSFQINIFGQKPTSNHLNQNSILLESGLKDYIDDQNNGIEAMISSKGTELSPGIRKRIAIARALNSEGKIVVLDEPTETLDQIGCSQIYSLINKLNKERKTIIIFSTDPNILRGATAILNLNSKTGASLFTPKQLEEYQKNFINNKKKYLKKKLDLSNKMKSDLKISKKKLN